MAKQTQSYLENEKDLDFSPKFVRYFTEDSCVTGLLVDIPSHELLYQNDKVKNILSNLNTSEEESVLKTPLKKSSMLQESTQCNPESVNDDVMVIEDIADDELYEMKKAQIIDMLLQARDVLADSRKSVHLLKQQLMASEMSQEETEQENLDLKKSLRNICNDVHVKEINEMKAADINIPDPGERNNIWEAVCSYSDRCIRECIRNQSQRKNNHDMTNIRKYVYEESAGDLSTEHVVKESDETPLLPEVADKYAEHQEGEATSEDMQSCQMPSEKQPSLKNSSCAKLKTQEDESDKSAPNAESEVPSEAMETNDTTSREDNEQQGQSAVPSDIVERTYSAPAGSVLDTYKPKKLTMRVQSMYLNYKEVSDIYKLAFYGGHERMVDAYYYYGDNDEPVNNVNEAEGDQAEQVVDDGQVGNPEVENDPVVNEVDEQEAAGQVEEDHSNQSVGEIPLVDEGKQKSDKPLNMENESSEPGTSGFDRREPSEEEGNYPRRADNSQEVVMETEVAGEDIDRRDESCQAHNFKNQIGKLESKSSTEPEPTVVSTTNVSHREHIFEKQVGKHESKSSIEPEPAMVSTMNESHREHIFAKQVGNLESETLTDPEQMIVSTTNESHQEHIFDSQDGKFESESLTEQEPTIVSVMLSDLPTGDTFSIKTEVQFQLLRTPSTAQIDEGEGLIVDHRLVKESTAKERNEQINCLRIHSAESHTPESGTYITDVVLSRYPEVDLVKRDSMVDETTSFVDDSLEVSPDSLVTGRRSSYRSLHTARRSENLTHASVRFSGVLDEGEVRKDVGTETPLHHMTEFIYDTSNVFEDEVQDYSFDSDSITPRFAMEDLPSNDLCELFEDAPLYDRDCVNGIKLDIESTISSFGYCTSTPRDAYLNPDMNNDVEDDCERTNRPFMSFSGPSKGSVSPIMSQHSTLRFPNANNNPEPLRKTWTIERRKGVMSSSGARNSDEDLWMESNNNKKTKEQRIVAEESKGETTSYANQQSLHKGVHHLSKQTVQRTGNKTLFANVLPEPDDIAARSKGKAEFTNKPQKLKLGSCDTSGVDAEIAKKAKNRKDFLSKSLEMKKNQQIAASSSTVDGQGAVGGCTLTQKCVKRVRFDEPPSSSKMQTISKQSEGGKKFTEKGGRAREDTIQKIYGQRPTNKPKDVKVIEVGSFTKLIPQKMDEGAQTSDDASKRSRMKSETSKPKGIKTSARNNINEYQVRFPTKRSQEQKLKDQDRNVSSYSLAEKSDCFSTHQIANNLWNQEGSTEPALTEYQARFKGSGSNAATKESNLEKRLEKMAEDNLAAASSVSREFPLNEGQRNQERAKNSQKTSKLPECFVSPQDSPAKRRARKEQ